MSQQPAPVLLFGVPDDMMLAVMAAPDGRLQFGSRGSASFLAQLRSRLPGWPEIFVGPRLLPRATGARPRHLVNHVADPDLCSVALAVAAHLAKDWQATTFNHPDAVRATGRDAIASRLADIPGLDVPRTVRLRPRSPADITATAEAHGLAWPLLARIAGDHGGVSLVQLDHPGHLDPLHALPWGGRELYLTEFRDFADADGRYRKIRLAVVGERIFIRHLLIGDGWLLHSTRRAVEDDTEEAAFLEGFDQAVLPSIEPAVREIARRLRLDYFGIDCSLRPDGRLLVFEANACMNILDNSRPSPNIWDAPVAAISDALLDLLLDPSRWLDARRRAEHAE